jgi:hypothetical protein
MDIKEQLKERLLNVLHLQGRKDNASKHRNFLIDCIQRSGYIQQREFTPELQSFVEPRSQTFFTPDSPFAERLAELQKRGMSYQDAELIKINETMDIALNEMYKEYTTLNTDTIKNIAMNYYIDILNYYKTDNSLKSISGSLKRGYIALCVYYALLYVKTVISKESLVAYFRYSLSDLSEANKNMKLIIKSLPPTKQLELCGMKKFLNENFETVVINQIQKIINHYSYTNPKNIAAAIYFVTSVTISKGGIYSKKLKTKNGDYITLEFISTFCKIVPSTISSAVKEIISSYGSAIF